MFAYLFGALSVLVVLGVARGIRRGRWARHGWGGGRRNWLLSRIFRRIDARPDQEAELQAAMSELVSALSEQRQMFGALRADLASAVTAESLDGDPLAPAFSRLEQATGATRAAVQKALARIHPVLDAAQRQRLADLLQRGLWGQHRPNPVHV